MRGAFDLPPGGFGPPCPMWHRLVLQHGACAALRRIEEAIDHSESAADVDEIRGWPASATSWRMTAAKLRIDAVALVEAFADRDGQAPPDDPLPEARRAPIPRSHGERLRLMRAAL